MGYSQCVQLLLKFGAGIEILMGTMKMSALHLAAQEGERNIKSKYYRKRFKYHLKCILQFVLLFYTIFEDNILYIIQLIAFQCPVFRQC